MTREEMATALTDMDYPPLSVSGAKHGQLLIDAAAAELRKTCAGCKHFERDDETCGYWGSIKLGVPADGSGHCHRHEGKP